MAVSLCSHVREHAKADDLEEPLRYAAASSPLGMNAHYHLGCFCNLQPPVFLNLISQQTLPRENIVEFLVLRLPGFWLFVHV